MDNRNANARPVFVLCDCDPDFPCRIPFVAVRPCIDCGGTGEVPARVWDNDANMYVWSGVRACICTKDL